VTARPLILVSPKQSMRDFVANYFHEEGWKCGECGFCKSWTEGHGERLSECGALEMGLEQDCPALPEEFQ
jgi:hypothetical protein